MFPGSIARVSATAWLGMALLSACSSDSGTEPMRESNPVTAPPPSAAAGTGSSMSGPGARPPASVSTPTPSTGAAGQAGPAMTPGRGPATPPTPTPTMPPAGSPMAGNPPTPMAPPPGMTTTPAPAPMPLMGDPNGSGATVSIPDVRCGPAAGLDAFVSGTGIPGPGTPNLKVGGRDVVLSYPCDKKAGAHVTFILNLHGTMPEETLKLYQHGYFSAHKLVNSHNLIVATPRSVSAVGQWDNGAPEDIPHLYEVVDWVYEKFGKQFQITGMWMAGHSWGSMFAKRFVCDPKFMDKARGVVGQSGGAIGPTCSNRISQIHTAGELEGGAALNPDQTVVAAAHGCDAMTPIKDIGKGQMLYDWPNCDPGWVHFNFVMGAHDHITAIDDPVVKHIVDAIKSTEK